MTAPGEDDDVGSAPVDPDELETQPIEIPVPFLSAPVGLGDVIAKITRTFGVAPCKRCDDRKKRANSRFRFKPMKRA